MTEPRQDLSDMREVLLEQREVLWEHSQVLREQRQAMSRQDVELLSPKKPSMTWEEWVNQELPKKPASPLHCAAVHHLGLRVWMMD